MVAPNLQITAFGSHTSTVLALLGHPGVVTVSGASGVGKSLLIDALVFALTGTGRDGRPFDVRTIRNGVDKCEVKAEIGGHRVKASVTRAGSWARNVDGVSQPNARDHHAALGLDGRTDVARFVVAPMLTPALLGKELGRPLRDLLTSVLPKIETRGVVAAMMTARGVALDPSDSVDLNDAEVALTSANAARNPAAAVLQRAQGALDGIEVVPAGPTDAEAEAARAVVGAAAEWARYDRITAGAADRVAHRRSLEEVVAAPLPELTPDDAIASARAVLERDAAHRAYVQAVADRRASLAAREVAEMEQARRTRARAELGEVPAVVDVKPITDEIGAVERGLAALRAKAVPCGECGAPKLQDPERVKKGDEKLAALRERLASALEGNRAAATHARALAGIGDDVAIPDVGPAPVAPCEPPDAAQVATANATLTDAATSARLRESAIAARDRASSTLASLADAADDVGPGPTAPRPTDDAAQAAAAVIRRSEATAIAAGAAERQRARAVADVARDTAALDTATTTATRKAAVLDCARKAPSIIADRQRALFGDLGCVQLRFPPDEGRSTAAIEILVETEDAAGHVEIVPWDRASTGWRILADLHLRAAVRRLSGLDWLPIFVDEAQSWSGDYPEIPGLIQLWTTEAGSPLSVALS